MAVTVLRHVRALKKWLLKVTAHVQGRAAPEPRHSDSRSHSVARKPWGRGNLTQPRDPERLPEGGDHVQERGVSLTVRVRRVMKGISG